MTKTSTAAALTSMAAEPVDVLVIGGGITGAGIARDAALRGFRTAVVDKGDLGGGTSSLSSRLIHGGIRYLEQGQFRLVFEASRERRVLLRIAPHLVHPLPFLFPVYRGARIPAWKLRAGMWLYDLLAAFHNVKMHRWLGRKATQRLEPGLRDKELKGAALYYDAQTDDARLVIATMRSAAHAGALVANYAEVTALIKPDGRVGGATVRDELTGRTSTVRALVVVNATGPWVDRVRRLDDAGSELLLRPTKGVHVTVPRKCVGHTQAVTLMSPIDGRVMFVLPWGDLSYIGTTDTDEDASPDELRATAHDVVYLLPVPGGETADLEGLVKAAMERGASERTARHLVAAYGSESAALLNLVDRDRALGRPIVAGRATLWAEVAHAVEREMAVRLSDVLVRRLHLFYATRDQAVPAASPVADWLAEALGWDATRRAEEVAAYQDLVARSRAFAKEAAAVGES